MQSFNKRAKNIDISKQERHCCNQTMFKTSMQYCEAYCQKSSLKLRLSINCHKKCDTKLWQIYRRWWLTQDIIWFGIFHFQSINFFVHICSLSEKKILGGDNFFGTYVHYRRENLWAVINFLGTFVHDIWENNFGRWCVAGVWGTTEVRICCPSSSSSVWVSSRRFLCVNCTFLAAYSMAI